jgi:hypothetical protein
VQRWWVKAQGVFLNESRESAVAANGTYEIQGLEMGTYLIEVFEGSKLRNAQIVELDQNRPITDLPVSVHESERGDRPR